MKQRENTGETWEEIIRQAVTASGMTRYRIALKANIGESQLARFMAGAGLNLTSAERLGRVLGLTIASK